VIGHVHLAFRPQSRGPQPLLVPTRKVVVARARCLELVACYRAMSLTDNLPGRYPCWLREMAQSSLAAVADRALEQKLTAKGCDSAMPDESASTHSLLRVASLKCPCGPFRVGQGHAIRL
jgi:hypothetical protein